MKKREFGAEQPFVSLGIFKLRIPFVHYRLEWPEVIQGLVASSISASALVYHMENMGISYELALLMTVINELLYYIHATFGDPVCPGWITPAIPLVLAYLAPYAVGPDRIHAIMATQILVGVVFLFMGLTGLAKKLISYVPPSMQAGILLGSGVSAVQSVIKPGGRVVGMEISFWVGALISLIILYSLGFNKVKAKNKILEFLGKAGVVPGMIIALIVGIIIKEVPAPDIKWGIFTDFRIGEMIKQVSFLGIGFPEIKYFINCIPLVISIYIIAFGDFVLAETVVRDADNIRKDESIDFNASRSNILSSIRNFILGLFCPTVTMAGPLWGAGTIAVAERYKTGRNNMDSIFSGMGTLKLAMVVGILLSPIVSLFTPVMPILISITLFVQGFANGYIAMDMVDSREERGCATIMGVAIGFVSAGMGLLVGIILHLIIGVPKKEPAEASPVEENL